MAATVAKLPRKAKTPLPSQDALQIVTVTPEMAVQILERNELNRPLNDQHVHRIARQITEGKWKFNGDTIKVASDHSVVDGQHRLWAIIEAKQAVDTIIVTGIERDAFATIDTLRKPRSGSDVIALAGTLKYRNMIAAALGWLIRYQRGVLQTYNQPQNKVENSDIEAALKEHPGIARAVERCMPLRGLANPGIVAFAYYVALDRNGLLAEKLVDTLIDPAGVSINDPLFRLRSYFTSDHHKRKEAVMSIALMFKALNAARAGRKVSALSWKNQGRNPEAFPKLEVD